MLKITKKGEAFLKKPTSFKIVMNNLFEEANADDEEAEAAAADSGAADEKLVELLKTFERKLQKKKNCLPLLSFWRTASLIWQPCTPPQWPSWKRLAA